MSTTEVPLEPRMRWEWIKFQLRARGTSLAMLAREIGASAAAMKNAKRVAYPRMERAIAARLGYQPAELWPERWNVNGTPRRSRPNSAESKAMYLRKDSDFRVEGHETASAEG